MRTHCIHRGTTMNRRQMRELLLQSLEAELGGVRIYSQAIECAVDPGLASQWKKYLAETREHVETLQALCRKLGLDSEDLTNGREIVRHIGNALVEAMQMSRREGDPLAAQRVACECVLLAETKDHADWELIGQLGRHDTSEDGVALLEAYESIEDQEDAHLYHTRGWCRELWIDALGLPSVLPPPEERLEVRTAIGAARAQASVRAIRRPGDTEPLDAQ